MSRPSAPSMPTESQIQDVHKIVAELYPGARIVRVGPEGVSFDYPDTKAPAAPADGWTGSPFSDQAP